MREREVAEQLMIEIREYIPLKADCYTLLSDFYRRCYGIEIPRYEYNPVRQEKPPDEVWQDWEAIDQAEARPGDVVLLYSELGVHVGILLDNGEFLHSTCMSNPPVRIGKLAALPRGKSSIDFVRYRK